jgi:hypothetical protein
VGSIKSQELQLIRVFGTHTFNQVIAPERRRWLPYRRTLSKEDQAAFDRLFACTTQQLQSEVQLGRPWTFEAVLMAVLLAHAKRFQQVCPRVEVICGEQYWPDGNHPEGR